MVVNTHLYATSLAMSEAELLPAHDLVVFDEAHELEDIASAAFGFDLSQARLVALARTGPPLVADSSAVAGSGGRRPVARRRAPGSPGPALEAAAGRGRGSGPGLAQRAGQPFAGGIAQGWSSSSGGRGRPGAGRRIAATRVEGPGVSGRVGTGRRRQSAAW